MKILFRGLILFVMLSGGGANRDPRVYKNHDVLDLGRPANQLLTFG